MGRKVEIGQEGGEEDERRRSWTSLKGGGPIWGWKCEFQGLRKGLDEWTRLEDFSRKMTEAG